MANVSPSTKNPMGKPISSSQCIMIVNAYKMELRKNPDVTVRDARIYISKLLGIGTSFKEKFDDIQMNAVRLHVHSFWFNKTIPTLNKILTTINNDETLPNISRTNLYRMLKFMDFVYTKRSRNSALVVKDEIILWRTRYLADIRKYRDEGRHIYYLDETWVNAGDCTSKTWVDKTIKSPRDAFLRGLTTGSQNPSGKGKRLIVLHIGSEDGFVPGGLLCFESKKNDRLPRRNER
ncbi:DDE 3 domain-containing protein [Aphis craccivora]|uniref:DDE 3 domain-containing protein n=1 Tax=Aphis craccivora TaxID=307492 RepID=A0A6G0WDU5_APHCR|nr:DDE 3 domain-containing protein [Aphis craccivora]